jgi:hypothetical protein
MSQRLGQARELQVKQHCWADASGATAREQIQVSPNMEAATIGASCVEARQPLIQEIEL